MATLLMVAWFLSLSPAGVGFLLEESEMDKITSEPPKILRPPVRMSQQLQCVSTLHLLLASENCSKCANSWCICMVAIHTHYHGVR